jgi:ribonuclease VapC
VIAVDTSALMALLLGEATADAVADALAEADALVVSAGTVAEALIVAARRGVGEEMGRVLGELGFEVVPLSEAGAHRVAAAYDAWGRGQHPAGLNFGDCFAYAVARERGVPLLYVGEDFRRTDLAAVLP